MSKNFENKIAVITGGNSGIGYAAAKEFKERGATVVITGRRKEALEKAAEELGVSAFVADQSSLSDLENLAASIKDQYGSIDVLFINAGVMGKILPVEYSTEANFNEVMDINFKGAYFTLSKFIPLLKDGASVVFLSSIAAHVSTPNFSVYSASKVALNSIAKTAALELAPRKIRVNIVSPGPVKTEITLKTGIDPKVLENFSSVIMEKSPLGRYGEPVEIAKTVVYLCEDTSGYITGAEIVIDGGMAI